MRTTIAIDDDVLAKAIVPLLPVREPGVIVTLESSTRCAKSVVIHKSPSLFVMPAKAGTQGQRSGNRPGFPLARE